MEYADARSRSHQLYLCRKSFPHSPHLILSLLGFSMEPHVCISYSGHRRIESCIWQHLFVAYASTLPIRLALQPSSDLRLVSHWTMSFNTVCHSDSVEDHARDDGSEDYQSFLWVASFNATFEWMNANLCRKS